MFTASGIFTNLRLLLCTHEEYYGEKISSRIFFFKFGFRNVGLAYKKQKMIKYHL
jgi:hypothetical protein